jgi:hypothetical protein
MRLLDVGQHLMEVASNTLEAKPQGLGYLP